VLHRAQDSSSLLHSTVSSGPEAKKTRTDQLWFNASGLETAVALEGVLGAEPMATMYEDTARKACLRLARGSDGPHHGTAAS